MFDVLVRKIIAHLREAELQALKHLLLLAKPPIDVTHEVPAGEPAQHNQEYHCRQRHSERAVELVAGVQENQD